MPAAELELKISEDNLITWPDMVNEASGSAVTTATVTFTLKTTAGVAVSGAENISMPHVSGGTYQGTLQDSVSLSEGFYYLELTAVVGSNAPKGFRRIYCRAKYHGAR